MSDEKPVDYLHGIPVYDAIPEGWIDISHIISAPASYRWINNKKSIFDDEYKHGYLRIKPKEHQ